MCHPPNAHALVIIFPATSIAIVLVVGMTNPKPAGLAFPLLVPHVLLCIAVEILFFEHNLCSLDAGNSENIVVNV
jgi:hypothetical protein